MENETHLVDYFLADVFIILSNRNPELAPAPDPPFTWSDLAPAAHIPPHLKSAYGLPMYRLFIGNPFRKPINKETRGRLKMVGGCGEGGSPPREWELLGGAVAPPQINGCVYIMGSYSNPQSFWPAIITAAE